MMFKNYKISTLFDWQNGNTDLKKEHINGKGFPVVSSGVENTGIIGCTDVDARILPAHTITADMFGNVYYRDFEYKEVTHARVFTLIPKDFELDIETGLFFASSLKVLSKVYSYNNMCSYAKISNMDISLPVIENSNPSHEYTIDDIDWQYMREYITNLERDCITELEAYLQVTGLNDCELTEEDKRVLSDNTIVFDEKSIGDLFIKVEAKCKKAEFDKRKDTSTEPNDEFCIPLINAKLGDNGIMFYGRLDDWNTQSMCIDVVQNGAVATGKVYAQPQPTAVLWDAYLIKPIKEDVSEEVLLYFSRCIEKLTKERFSYEKKATWERIKVCKITIPITSDGEPDFDYMERYIRALEKVVIADVVKYKDKVIKTTEKIINE